jgi:glycogen debranching enzyme
MKVQASTLTHWMATRKRCYRSFPMLGSASGPASLRQNEQPKVVKRLMQKDMWSGWGIRALSADHPSFNPYNYQTGAVWPHDNSLIVLGMRRYGFDAEAAALAATSAVPQAISC